MNAKIVSTLGNAMDAAEKTGRMLRMAYFLPVPLIAIGAVLLQIFSPGHAATEHQPVVLPWYKDIFLISIFVVYAYGQVAVLSQLRSLSRGLRKTKIVVATLLQAGYQPALNALQTRLQSIKSSGHLFDLVNRWIAFGLIGDPAPINTLMEHAAYRRLKSVEKKISLHATVNRIMLKLGFLGTLIGLMMTFPPMKNAILTLDPKNIEKGASFVQLIAGAIDGDQYAILTTLIATGFSLFIELLTVQLLKSLCGRFEMVNGYVDEWSITELQPWIRAQAADGGELERALVKQKAFQQRLIESEKEFQVKLVELNQHSQAYIATLFQNVQEGWRRMQGESETRFAATQRESEQRMRQLIELSVHQANEVHAGLNRNLETMGRMVKNVAERMMEIVPIQQNSDRRLEELITYERQYRSFLEVQEQVGIPRHLRPDASPVGGQAAGHENHRAKSERN